MSGSLPRTGAKAWPGRDAAAALPSAQKAVAVEAALLADISKEFEDGFDHFIPFVMMHEFEGLLFSDCSRFSDGMGLPELAESLQAIRDQFGTPEEINDSPITCPSKRIQGLVPRYEKPLFGTLAVLEIGLTAIRNECPHFESWVKRLEGWVI